MSEIRILSRSNIAHLLALSEVIEAVERAYVQKSTGKGSLWPMVFHEFQSGHADLDIKSGDLGEEGIFGFKLVSWFGDNRDKGLPELFGTAMIFDITSGRPKALLDAGAMTHLRTGAAGAIGAKYLARPDSKNLLMVGTGGLAPFEIAATLSVLPDIENIWISNPRNPRRAIDRIDSIKEKVRSILADSGTGGHGARISVADDLKEAVVKSDVIVTATPSTKPIIRAEWITPGTHLSCMGSDMSGKQELESSLFRRAKVVVDDVEQCLAVGECEIPTKENIFSRNSIHCEIGEIIGGLKPGRTDREEITLFDSTGIALQDLACSALALAKAEERKMGTVVEL